jgi:hypothetical protein
MAVSIDIRRGIMVIFKNVRTAIQKFHSWRTNVHNNKAKARQSRRDFLKATGRAAIIPAGIMAVGIPLAHHLLSEKTKLSIPTTPKIPTKAPGINNRDIKTTALSFLKEVKEKELMSIRYRGFITKVTELILQDRISIRFSSIPNKQNVPSLYHPETNTILIDPNTPSNTLRSRLIFDLFIAYFDYLAKKPKRVSSSHIMAHAHLAEADYSFQAGSRSSDSWMVIKRTSGNDSFPIHFNIPVRIIKECQDLPPRSAQYKKAIDKIARASLFVKLFTNLNKANFKNVRYIMKKAENLPRKRFIAHLQAQRKKAKSQITISYESITAKRAEEVDKFITVSYLLAVYFHQNNQTKKGLAILNDTLNKIQDIYRSADLSALDGRIELNGIN